MTSFTDGLKTPPEQFVKITRSVDHKGGKIHILTQMGERVMREMVDTKNDMVRNALIDLGWTPPELPCKHCGFFNSRRGGADGSSVPS